MYKASPMAHKEPPSSSGHNQVSIQKVSSLLDIIYHIQTLL